MPYIWRGTFCSGNDQSHASLDGATCKTYLAIYTTLKERKLCRKLLESRLNFSDLRIYTTVKAMLKSGRIFTAFFFYVFFFVLQAYVDQNSKLKVRGNSNSLQDASTSYALAFLQLSKPVSLTKILLWAENIREMDWVEKSVCSSADEHSLSKPVLCLSCCWEHLIQMKWCWPLGWQRTA